MWLVNLGPSTVHAFLTNRSIVFTCVFLSFHVDWDDKLLPLVRWDFACGDWFIKEANMCRWLGQLISYLFEKLRWCHQVPRLRLVVGIVVVSLHRLLLFGFPHGSRGAYGLWVPPADRCRYCEHWLALLIGCGSWLFYVVTNYFYHFSCSLWVILE